MALNYLKTLKKFKVGFWQLAKSYFLKAIRCLLQQQTAINNDNQYQLYKKAEKQIVHNMDIAELLKKLKKLDAIEKILLSKQQRSLLALSTHFVINDEGKKS